MNKLDSFQRGRVVRCLVEGQTIRATVRITGIAKNTIVKLLAGLGAVCQSHHSRTVRNLTVRRLQCQEIWSFVDFKKKNAMLVQEAQRYGDVWTWTAIDADTKLCVAWLVGGRHAGWARALLHECAARIISPVQVTFTSRGTQLELVEGVGDMGGDDAQLHRIYGRPSQEEAPTSFPAPSISYDMAKGQNLTISTPGPRLTGLDSAFSKRVENHRFAIAMYFVYYNFCRSHQALGVTPAMAAGLADRVWSLDELLHLIEIFN